MTSWRSARNGQERPGNKGAVHVYTRTANGSWGSRDRIYRSDSDAGDYFGDGLAFNEDASILAIGAFGEDSAVQIGDGQVVTDLSDNSLTDSGAVFVYRWDSALAEYRYDAMLKTSNAGSRVYFGDAVAASGNQILVGAIAESSLAPESGAAYLFSFDGAGWTEDNVLKSDKPAWRHEFGKSVALQPGQAIVGAPEEHHYYSNYSYLDHTGQVHLFE